MALKTSKAANKLEHPYHSQNTEYQRSLAHLVLANSQIILSLTDFNLDSKLVLIADDKFKPRVSVQEKNWNADSYAAILRSGFKSFPCVWSWIQPAIFLISSSFYRVLSTPVAQIPTRHPLQEGLQALTRGIIWGN